MNVPVWRQAPFAGMVRKPLLTVILLCTAVLGADPLWYPDPSLLYPRNRYIIAIGIGNRESEARAAVMSEIAQYFHSSVQAEENLLIQYNGAVSSSTLRRTREQFSREEQMRTSVRISSIAEFRGIQFTVPGRLGSGEWAVLGYIDREESLRAWESRAENNRVLITSLVEAGGRQEERLYRYAYMKQAASLAGLLIADIEACSQIGSSDRFAETLGFARRMIEDYAAMRSSLSFELHIEGDRDGQLRTRLSGLLNGNGYVVVPRNGWYRIEGEVSAVELTMAAGLFVRIGAELRIVNGEGRVLQSFTIPANRQGAYDWDTAYMFGFRYLGRYLEDHLIGEMTAFIDG